MAKATRRNHAEPSLSGLDDDDEVIREDAPLEAEQSAYLRNEARNERMHVRVQLPFHVVIDGRRYAGHDISTSGFSTAKRPAIDSDATVQCDIYIRCNGFRAAIPTTGRLLGERDDNRGGRFEFTEIADAEASILRRLVRSHLAGVHLTLEQLAAKEDPQTVRERVKKTVRPPNPAPSLLRFGGTLAAIGVLLLVLGAALYERLFVIEPDFAAVTAPEIRIYAPTDGELAPHEFDPGDMVKRDQVLVEVNDPEAEAQLVLAEATLNYNARMLENLRESLAAGGSATILTGGTGDGEAPVLSKLSPLELRARIKELESTYGFAKAKLRALEARTAAGTVYAPCDCIVHTIRSGAGGYWVQKGALIAQVIRNGAEDVTVEALVHLGDISAIEPNERAEVVMPTTGETHTARVTSIQLESQNIERAGFPEWARQDMSHGSVILAMEDPLPPSLVGHPVEVRFIDTNSLGGEALAAVFGTLNDLLHKVVDPITLAFAEGVGGGSERLDSGAE
ncbi:MAG TPA: HlyD family efflux transporter periplasmic adaptor subunit [Kiloniellaceae bacterium]